jgi:hypothetical protein
VLKERYFFVLTSRPKPIIESVKKGWYCGMRFKVLSLPGKLTVQKFLLSGRDYPVKWIFPTLLSA